MINTLTTHRLAALFLSVAAVLALMLSAGVASAQSEVTGTLSSGTTATNTISGTVVSGTPSNTECSDGIDNDGDALVDLIDSGCDNAGDNVEQNDGGGGGGGGGSRVSNNNDGEVLGESTGVGGGGDILTPGIPNTGAGGTELTLLLGSFAALVLGSLALWRYRA